MAAVGEMDVVAEVVGPAEELAVEKQVAARAVSGPVRASPGFAATSPAVR